MNLTIVELKKQLEEHKKDKERSNAERTFENLVELPDTSARTNSDIGSPIPPSISSWNSNMYDDYDDYYTDISDMTYNEDVNPLIDLDEISAIENDPTVDTGSFDAGSDISDNNMGSPVPPFSPDYYSDRSNGADVYHYETEVGASEQVETETPLAEPVVNNDIPSGHPDLNISNGGYYPQEDRYTGPSAVDSSRGTSGSSSRKRTFLHGGTTIGSLGKRRRTTAACRFPLGAQGNDVGEAATRVESSSDSSDADDEGDVPVRRSRRLLNQEPSPTGIIPCVDVPVPASYLLDAYANQDNSSDDGSWSPSKN